MFNIRTEKELLKACQDTIVDTSDFIKMAQINVCVIRRGEEVSRWLLWCLMQIAHHITSTALRSPSTLSLCTLLWCNFLTLKLASYWWQYTDFQNQQNCLLFTFMFFGLAGEPIIRCVLLKMYIWPYWIVISHILHWPSTVSAGSREDTAKGELGVLSLQTTLTNMLLLHQLEPCTSVDIWGILLVRISEDILQFPLAGFAKDRRINQK